MTASPDMTAPRDDRHSTVNGEESSVQQVDRTGGAAGAVTATPVTRDGWPLAAVLTITDASGTQAARAHGGDDGALVASGLPPGPYTAIITAIGYQPVARTAVVREGRSAGLGEVVLERDGDEDLPAPGTWRIDPAHSSIRATAQHLGISSIHGRFTAFEGSVRVVEPVESSRVEVDIDAASIDTANSARDEHLRGSDFLDAATHPAVRYRASALKPRGANRWDLEGELTLSGVTRPVTLDVQFLGVGSDPWGGTRASAAATAQLRREDFAMTYNQALRTGIAAIGTTLRVDLDVQAVWEE